MQTDTIIRTLDGLFGRKDSYDNEELCRVDTLNIHRMDYDKSLFNVDFNDLLKFPKLFNLTIDGCMIDAEVMKIICSIPTLRRLTLCNCEIIEDVYMLFSELKITFLYLCNTNFDLSYLKGDFLKLRIDDMDFKKLSCYSKELNVSTANIKNIDDLLDTSFDEAVISKELYDKYELEISFSSKKFIVMQDNNQFVFKKVGY